MLVRDKNVCLNPVQRIARIETEHTAPGRTPHARRTLYLSDRLLLLRG